MSTVLGIIQTFCSASRMLYMRISDGPIVSLSLRGTNLAFPLSVRQG